MGPNNKKRSRKQWVKYRLSILRDCEIALPPDEVIEMMYDSSKMTDTQVDSIFLGCIQRSEKK